MEKHFKFQTASASGCTERFKSFLELAPQPRSLTRIGTDQPRPGCPCTSIASSRLLCASAKYLHSDLYDVRVARHLWESVLSRASRNRRQYLLAGESRS